MQSPGAGWRPPSLIGLDIVLMNERQKTKKELETSHKTCFMIVPITVNRKINGSKSPSPGKHTTNLRRHYNDYLF